jgi:hypothetical protein
MEGNAMLYRKIAMLLLAGIGSAATLAGETVGVSGSDAKFETAVERQVGDQKVKLRLTGTAMRKKFIFNVYAMASYMPEHAKITTAEQLAARNVAKQLHLIMVRDVDGPSMAESFESAIRANHPEPAFNAEIKQLVGFMKSITVAEGDQILLTHIPDVGFHVELIGKTKFAIKNKDFSKAVWDIYLGPNNLGDAVKKGLVSRL